jgi:ketosteroid isomerase-like protein
MSHPNLDLVLNAYRAFENGDMAAAREALADDFVLHAPGRGPMSGEIQGRDAAMARWQRQIDLLGGIPYKAEEYDVAVTDDHVIQLANVTAEVGGKTFTYSTCNVWRVRDGKIVEARAHIYDLYAWDEFWARLSEQEAG